MKKVISQSHMLFFSVILLGLLFMFSADRPVLAEDSNITISGKIVSIAYGAFTPFGGRKAQIVVEDNNKKIHTIHLGRNTIYIPHRTPVAGDKVSVLCIKKKGLLAGASVTYP